MCLFIATCCTASQALWRSFQISKPFLAKCGLKWVAIAQWPAKRLFCSVPHVLQQ